MHPFPKTMNRDLMRKQSISVFIKKYSENMHQIYQRFFNSQVGQKSYEVENCTTFRFKRFATFFLEPAQTKYERTDLPK